MLSSKGWFKQVKSLAIAGTGAFLAVVIAGLGDIDFGQWTPAVVAGLSVLVNMVKTYIGEHGSKKSEDV